MIYFYYILLVLSIFEISNCQNRITVPQSRFLAGGALNVRTIAPSTTTKKPKKAPSSNINDDDLNDFDPRINSIFTKAPDDFDLSEPEHRPSGARGSSSFGTNYGYGNGASFNRGFPQRTSYSGLGSGRSMSHENTENFMNCQCTCEVPNGSPYGRSNQYGSRSSRGCNQQYY
uniref:Uncharacterized protein n=1 Tax=Parastrongyloides trichosuri TaxID=131310 RepID=A0A0N4ZLI3_PARTI